MLQIFFWCINLIYINYYKYIYQFYSLNVNSQHSITYALYLRALYFDISSILFLINASCIILLGDDHFNEYKL